MTEQDTELLAERCASSPLAYRAFVLELTSPPTTYNLSQEVLGGLTEALHRLTPASLELDHFKRAMTYGDKLRINPPAKYHPLHPQIRGAEANNKGGDPLSEEQVARLLLIHGILGKITEAMELAPILVDLISDKADFDQINLIEELGDDAFYTSLVEHAAGAMPGNVVRRNVKKLRKRYKGDLFSAEAALNRDLDAERKALGDDTLGEDQ
jgi:hypothetical protein